MLKKTVFLFICFLMLPMVGFTLGLGDITVFSKLNKPLKAHIELLSAQSTHIDDISIKNASLNSYRRSNLPRPTIFNNVSFDLIKQANGSIIVELTSQRPVREPFITFIADLQWRTGRISREYTILLDPPEFIQKQIRTGSHLKKEVTTQTKSTAKKLSTLRTPRKVSHHKINYSSVIANHIDGKTYITKRADTLWKIAAKEKPNKNASTYQTMQALFALNPNAFIRNDINLLKQGQTLHIPTPDEIRQISGQTPLKDSSAKVKKSILPTQSTISKQQQNLQTTEPVDKKSQQSTAANKETIETRGQLKIIPTNDELLNAPVNSKEDLILINKALQSSILTIKSLKSDNEDLSSQINALTEKLSNLDRFNQNLDDKISQIDVQLNNQPKLAANSTQLSSSQQTNNISSQKSAIESSSQIAKNRQQTPLSDDNTLKINSRPIPQDKARSPVREILTSPVITMVLAIFTLIILVATLFTLRNQNEKRKQVEPIVSTPYPENNQEIPPPSYLSNFTHSNIIVDEISDSSVAISQQKVSEKDEEDMDFFEYFEKKINAPDAASNAGIKTTSSEATNTPDLIPGSEMDETPEITFDLDLNSDDIDAYEKTITTANLSDTILGEIDTYLAYGNYNEAEERLINELEKVPSDKMLHLKLFECYTYSNKREKFIQHAEKNTNLLRIDMLLRQRIEKMFEKTWDEPLDISSFN